MKYHLAHSMSYSDQSRICAAVNGNIQDGSMIRTITPCSSYNQIDHTTNKKNDLVKISSFILPHRDLTVLSKSHLFSNYKYSEISSNNVSEYDFKLALSSIKILGIGVLMQNILSYEFHDIFSFK